MKNSSLIQEVKIEKTAPDFSQFKPVCKTILVNGVPRLEIKFLYSAEIVLLVRKLRDRIYTSETRTWHAADCLENRIYIKEQLGIEITESAGILSATEKSNAETSKKYKSPTGYNRKADDGIERMKTHMLNTRFSKKTIKNYTEALRVLYNYHEDKHPAVLTADDVDDFIFNYIIKNNFSYTYQNQVISAVKLFYKINYHKNIDLEKLKRPKRGYHLPNILSREETIRLLGAAENSKHFLMLSIIYSSGLRCGELLNLRVRDIDVNRDIIHIKSAKGNRDRIVPLAAFIKGKLDEYLRTYEPCKDADESERFLFEGQRGGRYSERSLQEVIKKAAHKAGIKKRVKLHTLRHSYATHLMEDGVHLRYIQELLGHKSPKTTQIYTHVSSHAIKNIASPIDKLGSAINTLRTGS